jgi:DUF4097 and DUF4098 domain-containing protein YvlB
VDDRIAFDVGTRPALDVRLASGSLDVRVGAPGRTVVMIDRPADWEVANVGDSVVVTPKDPRRVRSARIVVDVPTGTRVEAKSASARARLDGAFGDVTFSSASGELTISGSCGSLSASTASGDIRSGDVRGDAEITTVSGGVDLGHVAGRLAVTTTSGDVRLAAVDGDLAAQSTSGDVDVRCCSGDAIAVRTVSGDVHIGLRPGIRVKPDLTTFSGRTKLPQPRPDAPDAPEVPTTTERRLVRVSVKTVSGDIELARVD